MRAINPWINFNGNAEEAFTFYKSVFGGIAYIYYANNMGTK